MFTKEVCRRRGSVSGTHPYALLHEIVLVSPELRLQTLGFVLVRPLRRLDPSLVELGHGVVLRYLSEGLDGADVEVDILPAFGLRDGGLECIDAEEGAGSADVVEAVESRAA